MGRWLAPPIARILNRTSIHLPFTAIESYNPCYGGVECTDTDEITGRRHLSHSCGTPLICLVSFFSFASFFATDLKQFQRCYKRPFFTDRFNLAHSTRPWVDLVIRRHSGGPGIDSASVAHLSWCILFHFTKQLCAPPTHLLSFVTIKKEKCSA